MRNKLNLIKELKKIPTACVIHELQGDCFGIEHDKKFKWAVEYAAELLGFSVLLPHEYEYSYKEKPLGQTIVF